MTYFNLIKLSYRIIFYGCLLVLLALGVTQPGAYAHHVSAAGDAGATGPIITISPKALEKGKWVLSVTYQRVDLDEFSDEFLEDIALAGFEEVHNTSSITIPALGIAYGVTDRFEISIRLPNLSRKNIAEGELEAPGQAEIKFLGDSEGIGDMVALGKYQILRENEDDLALSALSGLQIPTGSKAELDHDGNLFETEFQPGSGALNILVGAAVGKSFGNVSFNVNVLYSFVEEGFQDTDIGDIFNFNAAISYRITAGEHGRVNFSLELIGQDQQQETISSIADENSGGTQIFIAPGLRYDSGHGWGVFSSLAVPISEKLKGIQTKTDYRLIAGFSYSF